MNFWTSEQSSEYYSEKFTDIDFNKQTKWTLI